MSYYERLGPALEHEEMVLEWLRYEGCIANLGAKPYFRLPSKKLYEHVKMRMGIPSYFVGSRIS